ncbi:glutathione S-transferase [Alphaproteobacteria bacterium 46_93_T64]|nr:glutathione S-transferase [Alphaproteobacteria bacterium 46_93_T64]
MASITVHHLNNSRSQRILWLLEELGVEYDIKHYQRDPETMLAPPELYEVHPLGKSPVITDGDVTVAETGAIIEYLVERYGNGNLAPEQGSTDRLRYTYWLHYAEGSAMPPLLLKLVFDKIENGPAPFFVRPIARGIAKKVKEMMITPRLNQHLNYLEDEIQKDTWFAGEEFSAADIQMSFPLQAATARAGLDGRFPGLQDFLNRIESRPAYKRALERGGEYKLIGG